MSGIQVQRSNGLRNPCFEPPHKKADQKQQKQYLNINKPGAYTALWKQALPKAWCYLLNSAVELIPKCEKQPTNPPSPSPQATPPQPSIAISTVVLSPCKITQSRSAGSIYKPRQIFFRVFSKSQGSETFEMLGVSKTDAGFLNTYHLKGSLALKINGLHCHDSMAVFSPFITC